MTAPRRGSHRSSVAPCCDFTLPPPRTRAARRRCPTPIHYCDRRPERRRTHPLRRPRPTRARQCCRRAPSGRVRAAGWEGECLLIRLSPITAGAVLGASTELTGTVVSLEDVWATTPGRVEDGLRTATSWDERFTIAECPRSTAGRQPTGRSRGRARLAADVRRSGAGAGRQAGERGRLEPQAPVVPLPAFARARHRSA